MNKKNPLIISCEKSSFLIEKKLAGVISVKERSQLFVHKLICSVCREYEKQSIYLDAILRKKITGNNPETHLGQPDKAAIDRLKSLIINKLK